VKIILLIAGLVSYMILPAQQSLPPIGMWREHLPYNSAIDVAWGNEKIFCATPYSLFTVDKDNTIERLSRITGLNETGISTIYYDQNNNKLLIAYANSNIDILYRNDIINVPDIKRDNIIGDKTIYSVYTLGKDYYLSTGLGLLIIDGDRYEVKDSWFIGNGGNQVKVNGFTSQGSFFYAATEEGLKRTATTTANPGDPSNWQLLSGINGLPAGRCENVVTIQNKVIAQHNDSLFVQNGNNWILFHGDEWHIVSTTVSENKLAVCQRKTSGESRVIMLNADGSTDRIVANPGIISFPRKAILVQNQPWVADQFGGLSHFTGASVVQYKPDSPEATASGDMIVFNDIFYATAGEVNEAWNYQYNGNGVYVLKEGRWTNINRYRFSQLDSLLDYITIAGEPADQTVWAGSFGGGLLHIKTDQSFEIFKQNVLDQMVGDPGSYRVAGLAFDRESNLWVSNYGAVQPLVVRKKDKTWLKFSVPFFLTENALTQILIDDNDYKWIIAAKGGGLICFDDGPSIENTGDDRWKLIRAGAGNGNLPDGDVLCVARDKSGFIWVGTTNGIAVIQCPQDIFSGPGCEAVWPVVKQGNFAGYLFNGEEVRNIAVDGADRKWVATKNGVWLIDPTGEKVIYQFTAENSPLLSSDVRKITIDGKTGEVFFATLNGICSFRSTATEGTEKNENVLVFPNPVPPGYSGSIAIRGLVNNAIVEITELDGRLVYQANALGGQAIWDGRNYRGEKISSGVYLVLVTDPSTTARTTRTATKIVFLSR
jgi:ligand-binding sensor domain-containing protein